MKTTYYSSMKLAQEAATNSKNKNTFIAMGSCKCDCGESFAYHLSDSETLETIERFVDCAACEIENQ